MIPKGGLIHEGGRKSLPMGGEREMKKPEVWGLLALLSLLNQSILM